MTKFSVILPTYSGVNIIAQTFDSILNQQSDHNNYELVVVIDGPNRKLGQIAKSYKPGFTARGIVFKTKQFENNRGRFEARIAGAKLAVNSQLLFVDDRVRLADDFFNHLQQLNEKVAMPAVTELPSKNIISRTMNLIRRRIYGDKWGRHFEEYLIDEISFEKSPKGTTCLWIDKKIFLDACRIVNKKATGGSKFVNDDTRVLREIVEHGTKILRTAKLSIYYQPRDNFGASLKHLYDRGTRFIDYYHQPGTRFFPILVSIYAVLASLFLIVILKPELLYWVVPGLATLTLLTSLVISQNFKEVSASLIGLPLIGLAFSLGVMKGTLLKIARKVRRPARQI